jgi:hypothetical protein
LGIYKEATGRYTTIDNFIHNNEISRLDLIKIDTDGYELEVLKGGLNSLKRFYPVIVFELSAYILRANNQTFSDFEKILIPLGYELLNGKSGYKVTELNVDRVVPKAGSADIIALPSIPKNTKGSGLNI